MKVAGLVSLVLCSISAVSAVDSTCEPAPVYLFESSKGHHITQESPILDLDQSQLVLSDLSGTSRFHSISNAEDARIVSALNNKGLFSKKPRNSIMIVVDNVNNDGELLDVKPSFKIDKAPDGSFFHDFIEQTKQEINELTGKVTELINGVSILSHHHDDIQRRDNSAIEESSDPVLQDVSTIKSLQHNIIHDDGAFVHLKSLKYQDDETYNEGLHAIKKALTELIDESRDSQIIVIAVPKNTCTVVQKREKSQDKPKSNAAVLSASTGYKDLETCQEKTNKCSGHGTCQKTHNGKYACACKPSYNEETKKTTRWGGNACQKKDVSIEFQMFFWTGLGIVAVLFYGGQLLYSIGSEPLPGVLNTAKSS